MTIWNILPSYYFDLDNYEMTSKAGDAKGKPIQLEATRESWTSVLDPDGEEFQGLDDPMFSQWLVSAFPLQDDICEDMDKEEATHATRVSPEPAMPSLRYSATLEAAQKHRVIDESQVCPSFLDEVRNSSIAPKRFDVLLGRGRPYQEHPGNVYMKALIREAFSEYESTKKHRKTHVAESIVRHIHATGGRFLKKNKAGDWEQVPFSIAREKVSHGFRKKRELDSSKAKIEKKRSTKGIEWGNSVPGR